MKRTTLIGLILLSVSFNVMASDQCQTGSESEASTMSSKTSDEKIDAKDQYKKSE